MKLTCIPTSAVLEPITTFCASFSRDLSLQPPLRCTPISLSLTLFSVLVRSLRRRSFRPSSSPTAPPCFFFDRDRCPCFRTRVLHPSGPFLLRSPCFLRTPALVSLPPRHPPSSLQDLFVLLPRQSLGHPSRLLSLLFPFSNFVPTFLSIFPPVPCIPYDPLHLFFQAGDASSGFFRVPCRSRGGPVASSPRVSLNFLFYSFWHSSGDFLASCVRAFEDASVSMRRNAFRFPSAFSLTFDLPLRTFLRSCQLSYDLSIPLFLTYRLLFHFTSCFILVLLYFSNPVSSVACFFYFHSWYRHRKYLSILHQNTP